MRPIDGHQIGNVGLATKICACDGKKVENNMTGIPGFSTQNVLYGIKTSGRGQAQPVELSNKVVKNTMNVKKPISPRLLKTHARLPGFSSIQSLDPKRRYVGSAESLATPDGVQPAQVTPCNCINPFACAFFPPWGCFPYHCACNDRFRVSCRPGACP